MGRPAARKELPGPYSLSTALGRQLARLGAPVHMTLPVESRFCFIAKVRVVRRHLSVTISLSASVGVLPISAACRAGRLIVALYGVDSVFTCARIGMASPLASATASASG